MLVLSSAVPAGAASGVLSPCICCTQSTNLSFYSQIHGQPHLGQANQVLAPRPMAQLPLPNSVPAAPNWCVLGSHGVSGKSACRNETNPGLVSPKLGLSLGKPS